MSTPRIWPALAVLLCACNRYDMFTLFNVRANGYSRADVLFVIDNSDSMADEAVALAESFGRFARDLAARQELYGSDGLPDAVEAYTDYVKDPSRFVDFQIAITTADAATSGGLLYGEPPILSDEDPDLEDLFIRNLLCEATCFPERATVPQDPGYSCGQPFETVSQEQLDCLCGAEAWIGRCGAGREEGIEAVYDALCRADPDPPARCFDEALPAAADAGSNAGLLREDALFVPVIVTDEGDASHRMTNVDFLPGLYVERLDEIAVDKSWAVIGPALDEDSALVCDGLATSWGALRYQYLVQKTGGLSLPIQGPDCGPADWDLLLQQLGELVSGGLRAFILPEPADPLSLIVQIGDEEIARSFPVGEDIYGETLWSDGFHYDEARQTVYLHNIQPELSDDVFIWYHPAR